MLAEHRGEGHASEFEICYSVLDLSVGKRSEIMNSNQFVFQSTKFNIATRGQHVT